jgi:hypothetical protein
MSSQCASLGQVLVAPILGVVGSAVSVPAALAGSALLLIPALGFNLRAMGQDREAQAAVE